MAKEIERKFLVINDSYQSQANSKSVIRQAYLSTLPTSTVRVRTIDNCGYLTVKGVNKGATRSEWEYEIPVNDALSMMKECAVTPILEKVRYRVGRWEIDEFHGNLEGLTVAEIELTDEKENFDIPTFIGREVTGDERYYNSVLILATSVPSA
ncbi:MAG: CYTH domain-containing protein [Firmicutes bacterium]|nr:CYTH domain-containing protein [Bacillota bacterium]MCM1401141.1 CYTH domain-containing protein [Bacteroides sp.]MCM1477036.1 CYTH domain-containing protein [Bacteroides sp.]